MRWLTTDRIRCLDCGHEADITSRWLREESGLRCPACQGVAVERRQTFLRLLRDVIILSNAA
jgi:DNA-directed RNA polymerase subunit RPC12/RpoP